MTAIGEIPATLLAAGPSVSSQLFGSALIGVREGLEAGIVVTILVAFLVKSTAATPSNGCGPGWLQQSR